MTFAIAERKNGAFDIAAYDVPNVPLVEYPGNVISPPVPEWKPMVIELLDAAGA